MTITELSSQNMISYHRHPLTSEHCIGIIILLPPYSPHHHHHDGGRDGCETKRVWQDYLLEFDFGEQLRMTEKPTHLTRSTSLAAQRGLTQLRSGEPGCIRLSDTWSVKVCFRYTSPTGTAPFCWFSHRDYVDLYLFHQWGSSKIGCIQSWISSSTLLPWVAL